MFMKMERFDQQEKMKYNNYGKTDICEKSKIRDGSD